MRWRRQVETAGNAVAASTASLVDSVRAAVPPLDLDRARASLREGGRELKTAMGRREAIGSGAVGALAIGAMACGAVAVGAFAIGRLSVGRARIGEAEIGRLRIGRLEIDEIAPPSLPDIGAPFRRLARWR